MGDVKVIEEGVRNVKLGEIESCDVEGNEVAALMGVETPRGLLRGILSTS